MYLLSISRIFRSELANSPSKTVKIVRGKGLFNAVVIEDHINSWDVCLEVKISNFTQVDVSYYITVQGDCTKFDPS